MKTVISIPDGIFEMAERLARRPGRSRNEVYSAALAEYVARHEPEATTDAMNGVCDQVGDEERAFVTAAARLILEGVEW